MPEAHPLADTVLMVRPARFSHNELTAATNTFQQAGDESAALTLQAAQTEFDLLKDMLIQNDVYVIAFQQPDHCLSPDAVFPNNWISFHDDRVILYPLLAANRRSERQPHWAAWLATGRPVDDWSLWEQEDRYLEGTGSLVLDRQHRRAYAALSLRTDAGLVRQWCAQMGYEPILFHTALEDGLPVYHTNVVMSIGMRVAVVCAEAIVAADRLQVLSALESTHRLVVISLEQMKQFCGNILLLRNRRGATLWALSKRAWGRFTEEQRTLLATDGALLPVSIPVIERTGGGSVRCMLAEVY
ncbi:MAG: arginine deiminase-related protein [Chitinophagales bacterium]|nr:arginine deiminase-related protein [Chitinophagales bacterium]MDW8393039.1 arginine deiminase-related protein [Chitinophagales bacterium]